MAGDAREQTLSLAFMRDHPAQAARVLEGLPAAEVTALFERAPARVGAAVLTAMLPRRAARNIAALDDRRALDLLAAMGTQPTVAVLRHLPDERRRALTSGLPTAAALASAMLLGYGEETLGAWADPDVVLLPADTHAAAALDRMRQARAAHPLVFVANAERRLAGIVPLSLLLRAPPAATLASLMQAPLALLPAFAPLAATAAHPGWEHASALPVVEPGDRLVGILTRDALSRALRRGAPPPAAVERSGRLSHLLAQTYWNAVSGLLGAGLALLPQVAPVADAERRDDER
ncbi:magnesium transporter MgtE N-terminal domain-containing protein [Piscinibacter sakaiensis]|uniref:magnesium transporter MgtE N-terminal domain-containing protein n=1 Tax=Piscinibacter sakaiensis TaxID=1547922 RepID=UPI003AAA8672